jgi:hypothetical protein
MTGQGAAVLSVVLQNAGIVTVTASTRASILNLITAAAAGSLSVYTAGEYQGPYTDMGQIMNQGYLPDYLNPNVGATPPSGTNRYIFRVLYEN